MSQCHYGNCKEMITDINPRTKKAYHYCPDHMKLKRKLCKERYIRTGGAQNEKNKEYNKRLRVKFIKIYGGKCNCCGIKVLEFLTLDHVQNDGKAERTTMNGKTANGYNAYRNALKQYNPKRYQILCFNCNTAKYFHGSCPCQSYDIRYDNDDKLSRATTGC